MRSWQRSIGRDAAIALYATGWYVGKTAREIAEFQTHTAELCMPFDQYQRAMEEALGRPVFTHEFAFLDGLLAELMGERPTPSFEQVLALIPGADVIVVNAGAAS